MLRKVFSVFLLTFLVFFASCAKKEVSYLFVLNAKAGKLNAQAGTLVLTDVSKSVFFFTDRPNRRAGKMPMNDFLSAWTQGSDSFKKDHPNASVVGLLSTKDAPFTDIAVILSRPNYNSARSTLTFSVAPVGKEALVSGDFDEIVAFVDGLSPGEMYPGI
ncbi:MAG: hypothetical protein FJZ64_02370 [Chlamydiae bacterium]|nr:hypothetical protein [Chlamydiota bacterium]